MGDLTFNPAARPGDPDWRVLYGEVGDGASGESRIVAIRNNPQRLDNLVGKIIRIIPDLNEHVATSTVSDNGRYRVPNDNPFVKTKGARPEIWAYGLRNPHRLSWAPDPANPREPKLIANSVGYRTWETVNVDRDEAAITAGRTGKATRCFRPTSDRMDRCPKWTRSPRRSARKSPTRSSHPSIPSFSTHTTRRRRCHRIGLRL